MNRAERRRLSRQNISSKEIRDIELSAGFSAIDSVVEKYTAAVVLACQEELGFGKIRTLRLLECITSNLEAFDNDTDRLENILKYMGNDLEISYTE